MLPPSRNGHHVVMRVEMQGFLRAAHGHPAQQIEPGKRVLLRRERAFQNRRRDRITLRPETHRFQFGAQPGGDRVVVFPRRVDRGDADQLLQPTQQLVGIAFDEIGGSHETDKIHGSTPNASRQHLGPSCQMTFDSAGRPAHLDFRATGRTQKRLFPRRTRRKGSGARSLPPVRKMVSGSGGGQGGRAQRDDSGHGRKGRTAFRADRFAEGRRWARLRFLFELRKPQGPGTGNQPARDPRVSVAHFGTPGHRRGAGGQSRARGERGLFSLATARQPARRLGVAAKLDHRRPEGAGKCVEGAGDEIRRPGGAVAAALGWMAPGAGNRGILAGRRSRLHDRLRYRRHQDGWSVERLAP